MMGMQATCTGHSIACIRHKTQSQTTPMLQLVYFSNLIAGGIGCKPAVEALRHIPTFHRAASEQAPAPLTVSTGVVLSQELPPKKDDEEPVTTEMRSHPR